MKTVNVHEAKTQLSKLLRRVAAGEEIAIANRGVPVARLLPVVVGPTSHRELGIESGRVKIAEDFDDALPDSVLQGFLGGRGSRKARRR
jgi:prevent-host-death family protein